jgi:hypothetical protein
VTSARRFWTRYAVSRNTPLVSPKSIYHYGEYKGKPTQIDPVIEEHLQSPRAAILRMKNSIPPINCDWVVKFCILFMLSCWGGLSGPSLF